MTYSDDEISLAARAAELCGREEEKVNIKAVDGGVWVSREEWDRIVNLAELAVDCFFHASLGEMVVDDLIGLDCALKINERTAALTPSGRR